MLSSRLKRFLVNDEGVMSHALLITLLILSTVGMMMSIMLSQLQLNAVTRDKQVSHQAANHLATLILSDLNDGYPADYLTMSSGDLEDATLYKDGTSGGRAYATEFTADDAGWTYVKVAAFPSARAKIGQAVYTYKYHASSNIGYLGTNDSGRPVWAGSGTSGGTGSTGGTSAGATGNKTLGLYELYGEGADKSDPPAAPWESGSRPDAPQNLRIIRTVQYGVVLAWDRPGNAGASDLNGYEAGQASSPVQAGCSIMYPNDGDYDGVAGFIVLNKDIDAAPRAWQCNATANSKVYVQGTSPNGLGAKAIGTLDTLPVTSDEFPAPPVAPKNLAVKSVTTSSATVTWDAVTCKPRSTPEYRFVWVEGGSGASDWVGTNEYTADITGINSTLTWKVQARCAGKYNNSTSVESETMTFVPPSEPAQNLRIIQTTAASTQMGWDPVVCVDGSSPLYRASLTTLTGVDQGNTAWSKNTTATWTHTAGQGFKWKVQVKCVSAGGIESPIVNSDVSSFVAPPAAPTGLAVVGTPGATQTTVTWNAAYCSSGSTPEYQFSFVPSDGTAYPVQTGTTIKVTNPTDSGTATWTVSARCTYGYIYSAWVKPAKNGTYPLTIAAPTAATSLKIISNANGTAGWSPSVCTTSGSTPTYNFQWVSPSTGTGKDTTTTQYSHTTRTEGVDLTWRVVSTCVAGERESKSVNSAVGPAFYYKTTAPTGSFTVKTNGVSTVSINTSTLDCGPGSYLIYRSMRTQHGNDTSDVAGGGWTSASSQNISNYEGWLTRARGNVACKSSGDDTLSGSYVTSTNEVSWTRAQSTAFNLSGGLASYRNASWSGQCNAGNDFRTYYWQVVSGGRELGTGTGWTDQRNYSNQGVAWGSGYVRVQGGCRSQFSGTFSNRSAVYQSPNWQ